MLLTTKRKRIFTLGLATCMVAGLLASVGTALAASAYSIRFYDSTTGKEYENTTIVEGSSINIRATLPPQYAFSEKTPFAVRKSISGPIDDPSTVFDIKKNSEKNYTLIAKPGSADGASAEYILNAIYTAIIAQGSGIATYKDPADPTIFEQFALRVDADPALSITEDSSVSFTAQTDENEYGMVEFGTVKATNSLADYNGSVIRAGAIASEGGTRYINIDIPSSNISNPTPLKVKAFLLNVPGSYRIKKGTEFTLSFLRQTINSMILTVITPQKAVDDTIASVRENPTDPEATDIGQPYISLPQGETLTSIKSNFSMLRKIHRHNVDVDLIWSWKPNDAKYDTIARMRNPSPTVTSFEIIDRPKEDVAGVLEAYASYTGNGEEVKSAAIKIPILIYGTGVPPSVTPLKKLTGNPGAPEGETNPKEESIDKLPEQMDVYRGDADFDYYTKKPRGPYQYRIAVDFGSGRGAAQKMVINYLGDGGQVDIKLDGASTLYTPGTEIENPGTTTNIELTAMLGGPVRLQFQFFDSKGALMTDEVNWRTEVFDTRPNTDGTLNTLDLNVLAENKADQDILDIIYPDPKGVVPYGFDPKTNVYTVNVPFKSSKIRITPRISAGTGADSNLLLTYDGADHTLKSGETSDEILLEEMRLKSVLVRVTAEDGSKNSYTLNLTRKSRETNAQLKELHAVANKAGAEELIANFVPTQDTYDVSVPYAITQAKLSAVTESVWASGVFNPSGTAIGAIAPLHETTVNLTCDYDKVTGTVSNNITTVMMRVTAEDGDTQKEYRVNITREPPNDNRNLKSLVVYDANGKIIPFEGGERFTAGNLDYAIAIDYSTKLLTVDAEPEEPLSNRVTLTMPPLFASNPLEKPYHGKGAVSFKNIDVAQDAVHNEEKDSFLIQVHTTAESGRNTEPPYTIEVTRRPPNRDNELSSLAVTDDTGKTAVPDYTFRPETLEYDISVPYLMKTVRIAPVVNSPLSVAVADGQKITEKQPNIAVDLVVGEVKRVKIEVTAESGEVRTYVLRLKRQNASKEARLSKLQVDAHKLDPKFVPSVTAYEVVLPGTVQSYTIIPTAIDPFATITILDKTVASGAATAVITPEEAETTVDVLVTAQDGKTQMVYTLTILAEALITKGTNADLKSLKVVESDMNPGFKPAIWNYEVSVASATKSVDIFPVAADPFATIKVFAGSKELGDHNGNFSTAILADKTDIKVEVTAHDGVGKATYDLSVYRDTEGKNGKYEPLTADMVDFETDNPIIIDITEHPVIAADVFNTLKEKYAKKTIVFKGNDYSLECKGTDLKQHVPNTETFNFSMSFSTPSEPKIRAWLDANGNTTVQPVYVHFEHHGPLPAAMKLTISIGTAYGNQALRWNYFNEDRERMDYYGDVSTNGQGTFSLLLSHMSDYLITREMLNGAENKVGMESGVGSSNLSSGVTNNKPNPTTAVAIP